MNTPENKETVGLVFEPSNQEEKSNWMRGCVNSECVKEELCNANKYK